VVRADELGDTTNALMQKQSDLQKAEQSLKQARDQVQSLSGGLPSLQSSLDIALAEVNLKQAQLDEAAAKLAQQEAQLKQQKQDREDRISALYKQYKKEMISPVLAILDSNDFRTWAKMVSYHQMSLEDDRNRIIDLDKQVANLSEQRSSLQAQTDNLKQQKAKYQTQVDSLRRQIANAKYRQSSVSNQVASLNRDIQGLSQKQQQILAAKAAANAVNTTIGDSAPVSSPPPPPPFSGVAYAFASYGVPHRVGMNQYGAYGRAQAGQNYKQILTAYFNVSQADIHTVSVPNTIHLYEYGDVPFENQYLMGIHEMPRSWPMEALKAQAVAARSYAMANLSRIASQPQNQLNQVYHPDDVSQGDHWDQRWYQAVRETRGVVITYGGKPISTYFSSTAGGITQQSGQVWSINLPYLKIAEDCNGTWPKGCYDAISPWFHKAWGDYSGKAENSTGTNCPTCNPWMSKQDMLYLINAALRYQQTNSASSLDGSLSSFTSPITNFADFAFSQNKSTGQTDAVIIIGTNQGTVNVSGRAMRAAVNLKAPGTIMLQTTLFDIIKH
jgi:SpoIID/LytB domain protein